MVRNYARLVKILLGPWDHQRKPPKPRQFTHLWNQALDCKEKRISELYKIAHQSNREDDKLQARELNKKIDREERREWEASNRHFINELNTSPAPERQKLYHYVLRPKRILSVELAIHTNSCTRLEVSVPNRTTGQTHVHNKSLREWIFGSPNRTIASREYYINP